MQRLDWTIDDLHVNLAVDEALLLAAEEERSGEVLRLWEFDRPVVVIGRGSRVAVEVDIEACQARQVPILRRASGGAAIVAGPGCLMYSLVLSMRDRPELRRLDVAHQFVMGALAQQIAAVLDGGVDVQGTCDLTWQNRKFSGNSLRVTRDHILYHGTLLYDADLDLLAACLRTPPRRPAYREDREHSRFVTNVPLSPETLRQAAAAAFQATPSCDCPTPAEPRGTPQTQWRAGRAEWLAAAQQLAEERYRSERWTMRH